MTRYAIVNADIKIVINCLTCKHRISPIPKRSGDFDCPYDACCRYNNYRAWEYIGGKNKVIHMENTNERR